MNSINSRINFNTFNNFFSVCHHTFKSELLKTRLKKLLGRSTKYISVINKFHIIFVLIEYLFNTISK